MIGVILKHPETNNKTVIISEPYEGATPYDIPGELKELWVVCAEEVSPNKHVITELSLRQLMGAEITQIIKPR